MQHLYAETVFHADAFKANDIAYRSHQWFLSK